MTEGFASVLMPTALRGCQDVAAVFDRSCTEQDVPVRLARLARECRGYRQHGGAGFRECTIECGEANVVADGHAHSSPWQIDEHGGVARAVVVRFAIAFPVFQIDVEHMNFVIACGDLSGPIDEEAAIGCTVAGQLDGE